MAGRVSAVNSYAAGGRTAMEQQNDFGGVMYV